VFLLAVVSKLRHPAAFARTVIDYGLLPRRVAGAVAAGLITLESFLASSLLAGWLLTIAGPLAAGTFFSFATAVGVNLGRRRDVRCGCFGGLSERISSRTLIRLGLLLAGSVSLIALTAVAPDPPTIQTLISVGAPALAYLLEIGVVATSLVFASLWLLDLPAALVVLRQLANAGRSRGVARETVAGNRRTTEAV
jgi:hypothetical protein